MWLKTFQTKTDDVAIYMINNITTKGEPPLNEWFPADEDKQGSSSMGTNPYVTKSARKTSGLGVEQMQVDQLKQQRENALTSMNKNSLN